MSSSAPLECPNCGTPSAGRYCSRCGQDNRRERLQARALLGDAGGALSGPEGAGD